MVEEEASALREAGDVVQAVAAGAITEQDLQVLPDLLGTPPVGGVTVFKSVGLAWQDLAIAEAVRRAYSGGKPLPRRS